MCLEIGETSSILTEIKMLVVIQTHFLSLPDCITTLFSIVSEKVIISITNSDKETRRSSDCNRNLKLFT